MKAKIQPSYDKNRQILAPLIPLPGPFTVYIEPSRICNFKCYYCMHSVREQADSAWAKTGYRIQHISEKLYQKIIPQVVDISPKRIVFSGLGEPLANPKLPDMIKNIRELGFKGRVDIITNGVLLTEKLIDNLIMSGISRIMISIQGLNSHAYEKNCQVKINYEEFMKNLKYLYDHRCNTNVFIKIIDAMLENKEEEQLFYKMFASICDQNYIEHLIVMEKQMGDHKGTVDSTKNLNNEVVEGREVCAVPFYHLNINSDGLCFPCPIPGLPKKFSLGDLHNNQLIEIWNGKRRNEFLKIQLKKQRNLINECKNCSCCSVVASDEENLDDVADTILQKINAERGDFK